MVAATGIPTLWEDWLARREHLAVGRLPCSPHDEMQIRVLDYLLDRYRDSPEAARPARRPESYKLFVDGRAIVVYHHAWAGRVGGTKSSREAGERVSSILQRMQSSSRKTPATDAGRSTLPESGEIVAAFGAKVSLTYTVVRRLYKRIASLSSQDVKAADLLVRSGSSEGVGLAVKVWRERAAAGCRDPVAQTLQRGFAEPAVRDMAAHRVRELLADSSPKVRMQAAKVLAKIGSLDDVALFSDLLNLPPQTDETPQEREILLEAMQSLAERRSLSE
jgi:hypothetical protein